VCAVSGPVHLPDGRASAELTRATTDELERQWCSPALELPSHAIDVRDWHEWLLGHTKEPAEWERVATEVIDVLHRLALRLVSNGDVAGMTADINQA
jgi:hypothetical protein